MVRFVTKDRSLRTRPLFSFLSIPSFYLFFYFFILFFKLFWLGVTVAVSDCLQRASRAVSEVCFVPLPVARVALDCRLSGSIGID